MVLNRSHIPWALLVALLSAASAALYAANFHPDWLPFRLALPPQFGPVPPIRNTVGGTPLGLAFGVIAFAIFLFASALGIRKKRRRWPIGHVQLWLKAHIWLTILTIPLVLFHCGFRLGGPMTSTVMWLYAIVMGSGFFGLAMQQILPRMMRETLPREVVYEQIPYVRASLVETALRLRQEVTVAERAARARAAESDVQAYGSGRVALAEAPSVAEDSGERAILRCLDEDCIPYLQRQRGSRHRLADQKVADDVFRLLKLNVAPLWQPRVEQMQLWCDDRRLMDRQCRYQHWLHGWLLIHVPLSFALLILTLWHAVSAPTF